MEICKYCKQDYQTSNRNVLNDKSFFANFDNHPVSPGHMKIISKRHINSLDQLTEQEAAELVVMVVKVKKIIDEQYHPDGYNIGINEGEAAGQTVFHLHIHVIPRYNGDVPEPIGGIRTIIPGKGNYRRLS